MRHVVSGNALRRLKFSVAALPLRVVSSSGVRPLVARSSLPNPRGSRCPAASEAATA